MGIVDETVSTGHCTICKRPVKVFIQWKGDGISWIDVAPHTCNMEAPK